MQLLGSEVQAGRLDSLEMCQGHDDDNNIGNLCKLGGCLLTLVHTLVLKSLV